MLTVEYEQSLVETAVFLAARKNEQLECELHLVIDKLYEISDEELRHREFLPAFRDFFTRLGLDKLIAGLIAERPLIGEHVQRCVVREAPRERAESAELFVRAGEGGDGVTSRTLVFQACPRAFVDSGRFVRLMRRELLHVSDMLDERFGYQLESFTDPLARQNLLRDRFRVLWDVYVEGRLWREGWRDDGRKARLRRAFGRVFANDAAQCDSAALDRVFDMPTLTHDMLLSWAREPKLLLGSSAAMPETGGRPVSLASR